MTREIKVEHPRLITKVSLMDTIRAMKKGTAVTYDCRQAGLFTTARSCVTRLNQAAGRVEFTITTDDNGSTYTVTRF